ncbi:MAG: hypothetical protein ABIV13_06355 [Fimbriimonadales bacterium]
MMTTLAVLVALAGAQGPDRFVSTFEVDTANLVTHGKNDYFILEPEFRLILEGPTEKVSITVLEKTKMVDGVKTRVVEEREFENGELKEVSYNYYAFDKKTKNVYYFGEDVDMYEDGKVVRHEGAWLSGIDRARFGLMMPGAPKIGYLFYQESAPGKALDRGEIVSLNDMLETPAGKFTDCLKVLETSGMDLNERGYKVYAKGIGMIQDEDMTLRWHGYIDD